MGPKGAHNITQGEKERRRHSQDHAGPVGLNEQLLDLVLEGDDLALELRGLVGGDRARDHRARHAARASESHLCLQTNQLKAQDIECRDDV